MRRLGIAAGAALLLAAGAVQAQRDFDAVEIRTVPVAGGVHMLMGAGGNMALSSGPDGAFLVDDQFAPLTEKIRAAIAAVSAGELRFVVNTHWHLDHTGGNENLGKAGAVIVAHDRVRQRMSAGQFMRAFDAQIEPAAPGALPVITFGADITFHLNGHDVHVFHVPPAHTDGGSIVHFRGANAIHMGDTFFAGRYPFVDLESGGSVEGVIATADRVLALADDATRIIPGHGELTNSAGLRRYRDMIATIRDRVRAAIAAGKNVDEVVAAKPTQEFDAEWGGGSTSGEGFTRTVYASLQ